MTTFPPFFCNSPTTDGLDCQGEGTAILELDYPPDTDLGRQCPACRGVAMDLRFDCEERSADLETLGKEADLAPKTVSL